jgi:hypothetical protein
MSGSLRSLITHAESALTPRASEHRHLSPRDPFEDLEAVEARHVKVQQQAVVQP